MEFTRINRPDVIEYHGVCYPRGLRLELWWDDQTGVIPGWCVRIIRYNDGRYVQGRDEDVPVKGRKGSGLATLKRNVSKAIGGLRK